MGLIDKLMTSLDFREWLYEIRHPAVVNPEIKKWVDSADKLKQTVEKLKAILKKKPTEKKPVKVEPEKKPTKVEPEKKVIGKPEEVEEEKPITEPEKKKQKEKPKSEVKVKVEPKNIIQKPTRLEKDRLNDKKGLNRNGRQP